MDYEDMVELFRTSIDEARRDTYQADYSASEAEYTSYSVLTPSDSVIQFNLKKVIINMEIARDKCLEAIKTWEKAIAAAKALLD